MAVVVLLPVVLRLAPQIRVMTAAGKMVLLVVVVAVSEPPEVLLPLLGLVAPVVMVCHLPSVVLQSPEAVEEGVAPIRLHLVVLAVVVPPKLLPMATMGR